MLLLQIGLRFLLELRNRGVLLILMVPVVDIEQVVNRPSGILLAGVFVLVGDSLRLGGVRDPLSPAEVLVVVGNATGALGSPSWALLLPVTMLLRPPTV